jgi:hypothetical protein
MLTITEGLAELKTIQKRLEKKRQFIGQYLGRQEALKDPFEKDGGAVEVLKRERQAMADLETRHVAIRTSIQKVNQTTLIVVSDVTKTIAEWLTWRKEVAPDSQKFLGMLRQTILKTREQAQQKGLHVAGPGTQATQPTDVIIHLDEQELAQEAERLETILGTLDGQLSLKNATVLIDI